MNLSNLSNIYKCRDFGRRRLSSYDRKGGNEDRIYIKPNETVTIAQSNDGPGCITHIWMTMQNEGNVTEPFNLRKTVLKIYWDDSEHPSVQAPIGDFFGMGHGISKNFVSAPLQMAPEDGKGFNCWWPMPFKKNFRFEIVNECNTELMLYFYIDYETYEKPLDDMMYFHALWNRSLTKGHAHSDFPNHHGWCFTGDNVDGKENYVILEAEGHGHYCGCNINIVNLDPTYLWNWPGEGDDMIFIDDSVEPVLNGTGTEDYVNMAWCPQQEYHAPFHGLILGGEENWKGNITYYRYHIQDPISFKKNIKVTIEHGHNNNRSDDWSTTAYWYQTEIHKKFADILPVEERMPIDDLHFKWTGEAKLLPNK